MTRDLSRLFKPRSIAVIGGGAWCRNVIDECRKIGFAGDVWPVHPREVEIGGCPAFGSVGDLPHAPDAVFIGVNRAATVEIVAELSAKGAGGAVCFASGFREAVAEIDGSAELEAELVSAAGDMPILGPNCYGLLNALDQVALWPDQHGLVPVERGVALISQSSNIAINLTMQTRGLPLAYVATVGNQAQTGLAGIGTAFLEDPRVTALGLYLEGVGDLRALEIMAARARDLGKPVIALKSGQSEQAQVAAVSHTASLAGSSTGADALFARLGIGQVRTLAGLLECLKLCHMTGGLSSRRVASISCSGGEAGLMADLGQAAGLEFPPLADGQRAALRAALGPKVALANPLDYHTYIWGDQAALAQCYTAMMTGDVAIGCLVLDFPRADRCDGTEWDKAVAAAAEAARVAQAPMALVSCLAETMPEADAQAAMAQGLIPLAGMAEAIEAIAAARTSGGDMPRPLLLPGAARETSVLSEACAKAHLVASGADCPAMQRVADADGVAAAADLVGYPVVLKGEGIAHKTEAGAVVLGLADRDAVVAAAQGMPAKSFLVEEMITGGVAELLVGVLRDPAHGFVLTLGAGGALTELWGDTAHCLLPATAAEVDACLDRLRIAPLLGGYRGAPPANRAAIHAAVQAVQDFVTAHAGLLDEVEINPLICTPDRAIVADALIRMGEPE